MKMKKDWWKERKDKTRKKEKTEKRQPTRYQVSQTISIMVDRLTEGKEVRKKYTHTHTHTHTHSISLSLCLSHTLSHTGIHNAIFVFDLLCAALVPTVALQFKNVPRKLRFGKLSGSQ